MSYFVLALLVGSGSMFLSVLLGAALNQRWDRLIWGSVASLAYGLLIWWAYWGMAIGVYGPAPLWFEIILGSALGAWLIGFNSWNERNNGKGALPGVIISGGYLFYVLFIAGFGATSDMRHSTEKAALIGTVEIVTDLEEIMQPADPAHICLVSESMAKVKAQAALSRFKVSGDIVAGSRYMIGDGTKQYVNGQLWWIFPVEFQGWLKWKLDKQVPGYLRVSAENPLDDAQAVQVNAQGKNISIKYLNSACFEYNAKRYLRNNKYMGKIIADWTFEPDDNWDPHYTVSILERTTGFSGWQLVGVVDMDLQTGKIVEYDKDEIPTWIDRGIPLTTIDYQIKNWGKYSKAGFWYVFWHDDKSQEPTDGWYLTYNGEKCQWFSGFTSSNAGDQALTGFTLTNGQTGETKFFKASGVTENVARAAAKSLWSNFDGYEPAELVPYNIYGELTYVVPIAYQGQFKGVSLIAQRNKDISAKGNTLESALNAYRIAMSRARSGSLTPAGGQLQAITMTGPIERVGMPFMDGEQQIFPFTVSGENKIFHAIYSYATPKTPFMKEDDIVVITYNSTGEKVITCETFDIPDIYLNENSPNQDRYSKNREQVQEEMDRINGQ